MKTIGILGANGFIATRLIELFHLASDWQVKPIVRSYPSLARMARFSLDWRIADAADQPALEKAFEGCDAIVHLVVGDPRVIARTIDPAYEAAKKAGAQRIVYLSTASVFGQAPEPGTNDDSPTVTEHALPYNVAKAKAEARWTDLAKAGGPSVLMLRPGVVFGPRSRWISDTFEAFKNNLAYFVERRDGVCNSIYVDNLVHAIDRALRADIGSVRARAYSVGDPDAITWTGFYEPIARACGASAGSAPVVSFPPIPKTGAIELLKDFKATDVAQAGLKATPERAKRLVKGALKAWAEPAKANPWRTADAPSVQPSLEIAFLHSCAYRLPQDRAVRELGYQPPCSFAEGMRRSLAWLDYAGVSAK